MVTIVDAVERQNTKTLEFFTKLVVQSVQPKKSKETNKLYFVTRRAEVNAYMDIDMARSLKGSRIEGTIVSIPCKPRPWSNPETGEIIMIDKEWVYSEDGSIPVHTKPAAQPTAKEIETATTEAAGALED